MPSPFRKVFKPRAMRRFLLPFTLALALVGIAMINAAV